MLLELTVILKDSERTFKQKFLHYDPLTLDEQNPVIIQYINEARETYNCEPEEININIKWSVK